MLIVFIFVRNSFENLLYVFQFAETSLSLTVSFNLFLYYRELDICAIKHLLSHLTALLSS